MAVSKQPYPVSLWKD